MALIEGNFGVDSDLISNQLNMEESRTKHESLEGPFIFH